MSVQSVSIVRKSGKVQTISRRPSPPTEFIRKDANLRVPDDGSLYVQIKPEWEVWGNVRQKLQGSGVNYPVPAIVNDDTDYGGWNWRVFSYATGEKKSIDYFTMPDKWLWFMWDFWDWNSNYRLPTGTIEHYYTNPKNSGTFAYATPGSLTWLYVNMMEVSVAWTDAWDIEQSGARDPVTGRNMNSRNVEWLLRPCTGHMLKVIGQTSTHYQVSCLDLRRDPPAMEEVEKHPEWICWATQVHVEKYTSRFPKVKECFELLGLPTQGTAIPLMAPEGVAQIKKNSCTILTPGAEWSPYQR